MAQMSAKATKKEHRSIVKVIGTSISDGSYKNHTMQVLIAATLVGWGALFLT
jgi:hypothetical protein